MGVTAALCAAREFDGSVVNVTVSVLELTDFCQ